MRYFFARFDEKHKLLGKFEKILKFFDENSIEKLNYYFFRKFVTKNRAFGNNTIFHTLCRRSAPPYTTVCGRCCTKGVVRLTFE